MSPLKVNNIYVSPDIRAVQSTPNSLPNFLRRQKMDRNIPAKRSLFSFSSNISSINQSSTQPMQRFQKACKDNYDSCNETESANFQELLFSFIASNNQSEKLFSEIAAHFNFTPNPILSTSLQELLISGRIILSSNNSYKVNPK